MAALAALALVTGLTGCAKLATEKASNKPPAAEIKALVAATRRRPGLGAAWKRFGAADETVLASSTVTGVWLSEGLGRSTVKIGRKSKSIVSATF